MLSKKIKLIEFENKRPIIYDLIYDNVKLILLLLFFAMDTKASRIGAVGQ